MGDHDPDPKGTSHIPTEPPPLRPRRRRGKDVERHACNVCRDRKVRCDRAFPKCGRCIRLHEDCSYDSWTAGPAVSQSAMARQLAELQERLAKAEALLAVAPVGPVTQSSTEATHAGGLQADFLGPQPGLHIEAPLTQDPLAQPFGGFSTDVGLDMDPFVDFDGALNLANTDFSSLNPEIFGPYEGLDAVVKEDDVPGELPPPLPPRSQSSDMEFALPEQLGQLHDIYLDTLHLSLPFLSRRRFSAALITSPSSYALRSLSYAVALLGTTMSAHLRSLQKSCYQLARRFFDLCEQDDQSGDLATIDAFQALILIVRYEIMGQRLERAWITIGRAIRMAKMLGLHQIDGDLPGAVKSDLQLILPPTSDSALMEERRRSFWTLYVLESYVSTRTGMQCHLGEPSTFSVRLPSPGDIDTLQSVEPMPFFDDVIRSPDTSSVTSFAGCIFMIELALRCFEHSGNHGNGAAQMGFWDRHYVLVKDVAERTKLLARYFEFPVIETDPVALSVLMNMCALEIRLHETAIQEVERRKLPASMALESQQQCTRAAEKIVQVTQHMLPRRGSRADYLHLQSTFVAWPISMAIKVLGRGTTSQQEHAEQKNLIDMLVVLVNGLDRVEDQEGYWHATVQDVVAEVSRRAPSGRLLKIYAF